MNKGEIVAIAKGIANRPTMADADVGLLLDMAVAEMGRVLYQHPRAQVYGATYTMAADDGLVPVPPDLADLIALRTPEGAFYKQFPPSVPSPPSGYVNRGTVYEVFPHPAVDDTVVLDYTAYPAPLEADADTNWLTNFHGDVVVLGLLKQIAIYARDTASMQAWSADFAAQLETIRRQGWNQNIVAGPQVKHA